MQCKSVLKFGLQSPKGALYPPPLSVTLGDGLRKMCTNVIYSTNGAPFILNLKSSKFS